MPGEPRQVALSYRGGIPDGVEGAARIDGAGPFRTFWSVVLPMARPALLTLTILSFQGADTG